MKYWQLKTKDLALLILQSLIQVIELFKKKRQI